MAKQEFTRISIDTNTYDKLTVLAEAVNLSRAEYIRRLIWSQVAKIQREQGVNGLPEPTPIGANTMASMAADYVKKRGKWLPMESLDPLEYQLTKLARKYGITIDIGFLHFVYEFIKQSPSLLTRNQEQPENGLAKS